MIYRTTVAFIFTLFLTQIARALPQACSDHIFPASKSVQHHLPYGGAPHNPAFVQFTEIHLDRAYDNSEGSMYDVECVDLTGTHPPFEDIPTFPYVGGTYDIQLGNSGNCGACWKLTNSENKSFGNGAEVTRE